MLIRQKACGANGTGQFDLFLPDLTGLGRFRFRLLVNGNTKRTRLRGLDAPRKRKGDQQPNLSGTKNINTISDSHSRMGKLSLSHTRKEGTETMCLNPHIRNRNLSLETNPLLVLRQTNFQPFAPNVSTTILYSFFSNARESRIPCLVCCGSSSSSSGRRGSCLVTTCGCGSCRCWNIMLGWRSSGIR